MLEQDAPVGSVCPFSFVPKKDRQTEAERLFLRQSSGGHLSTSPRPVCEGEGPGDYTPKTSTTLKHLRDLRVVIAKG